MSSLVLLTAYAEQPSIRGVKALSTPKVIYLTKEEIASSSPKKNSAGTVIGSVIVYGVNAKARRKYLVGERPTEVAIAEDPVTTNPYATSMDLAVSAAGSVIGTATAITKYLNKVTAATTTSASGVKLPSASLTQKAIVIINASASVVDVYPAASEFIDSGASSASISLAAGKRKHFYASSATVWLSTPAE